MAKKQKKFEAKVKQEHKLDFLESVKKEYQKYVVLLMMRGIVGKTAIRKAKQIACMDKKQQKAALLELNEYVKIKDGKVVFAKVNEIISLLEDAAEYVIDDASIDPEDERCIEEHPEVFRFHFGLRALMREIGDVAKAMKDKNKTGGKK